MVVFSSSLVSGEVRVGELMVGARRGEGGTRGFRRGDCETRGEGIVGMEGMVGVGGAAARGGVCPGMCWNIVVVIYCRFNYVNQYINGYVNNYVNI